MASPMNSMSVRLLPHFIHCELPSQKQCSVSNTGTSLNRGFGRTAMSRSQSVQSNGNEVCPSMIEDHW